MNVNSGISLEIKHWKENKPKLQAGKMQLKPTDRVHWSAKGRMSQTN